MRLYILVKSSKYENIVTLLGEDEAEPETAATVAGGVVAAVNGATKPGIVAPAATTEHAA